MKAQAERAKNMTNEFPYEGYKTAIADESQEAVKGIEAEVLRIESDETLSGGYLLEVKLLGKFNESTYEGGTVSVNGVVAGQIIDMNAASGMFTVTLKSDNLPTVGGLVTFTPPDYLQALRKFSVELLEKPEIRKEERFMKFRDEMLKDASAGVSAFADLPYLRKAQQFAVANAMHRDASMLWGPPGTGKSYTLGHIAERFRSEGKRVLVLSTTNAAVDVTTFAIDDACRRAGAPLADAELIRRASTLTQLDEYEKRPHLMAFTKLLKQFLQEQRILETSLKNARHKLEKSPACAAERSRLSFEIADIIQKLCTLGERRKEELSELVGKASIVTCSITACLYNNLLSSAFDVVLIDEASQVPLAVWTMIFNKGDGKRIVIAGDPMQLEPVSSRVKTALTGFWFGQNIYCYLGMTTLDGINPFCKCGSMTLLNEQTRMRRGICNLVSRMFYDGLLTGDRTTPKMDFAAAGLSDDDVIILDPCKGGEPYGFNRVYNANLLNTNCESASRVLDLVKKISDTNPDGRKLDVLVISPFRNQACKIYWNRLRSMKLAKDISVRSSTVHSAQGDEADVVIFDLVDPSSFFLSKNDAAHLWCVACSRAKEKLVIVGDKSKMKSSHYSSNIMHLTGNVGGVNKNTPRAVFMRRAS